MPSKLLPRNAEDRQSAHSIARVEEFKRREKWRSLHREEILDPELPIIDAHHHLWERPNDRYFLDAFLAHAHTGHNIKASVFVECGSFYRENGPVLMAPVGEVEFANGIAAMAASGVYGSTLVAAGIVGTADISVGAEVARVLDAQIAAGGGRFRGIRVSTKWDADEGLNTTRYRATHNHAGQRFPRGLRDAGAAQAEL
jgi:predicted TIM-barrel fold metal-dependent hydrolase